MPRPKPSLPPYRHHRASGQAFTIVSGRTVYLGKFDTSASKEAYARILRDWNTAGGASAVHHSTTPGAGVTVAQVLAGFLAYAKTAYPPMTDTDNNRLASEAWNYIEATKIVAKLYASTPAADFGPRALRGVRDEMIAAGWCLNVVNRQVHRVKRLFKWAVGEELIPGEVYHRLQSVESIRASHPGVRVTAKIRPADLADVDATLPFLPPRLAAMVRLQLLTGCRSSELCAMRTGDIDTTGGGVWVYRPRSHKTAHHGHDLAILIGPKAQAILRPFLRTDLAAFVFSPAEGEIERRAARHRARRTPLNRGNRPTTDPESNPGRRLRAPTDHYGPRSYARAITRAIRKANSWAKAGQIVDNDAVLVAHWHPHQLRHNRATEIRRAHGLDAAQAVLGHRTASITAMYAELDDTKARRAVADLG